MIPPISDPQERNHLLPKAMLQRWTGDLRVLAHLLRGKRRTGDHAADLDAFYGPQAHVYDHFRERLLPGRADFMRAIPFAPSACVADFGAGTGRHWLYSEQALRSLERLDLIDLCTPLLDIARGRFEDIPHVHTHAANAQTWQSPKAIDAAIFSYSLSMMPDWKTALTNASAQLKSGGILAVIDFYTLPAAPPQPLHPISPWNRWFWPRWFGHDGVMLRPQILPSLLACGTTLICEQASVRLPYLPWVRAPWFMWIGRPRDDASFHK